MLRSTSSNGADIGLPVLSVRNSNQHKSPSSKRSFKNLFTSKRSRRPPPVADLDFGCLGLQNDDDELREEDVLLEITAALPVLQETGRDRSGSRTTMDLVGGGAPVSGSNRRASDAEISPINSSTEVSLGYPSSARSSASFTTLELSFCSTASPTTSASAPALLTPSLSSSSCYSGITDDHHPIPVQGQILTWHPEETQDEAILRRKQEEQAAIEALEAYFAIQQAAKREIQESEGIVEGRRASEPMNTHRRNYSGMTVAASTTAAGQQARRGSAPSVVLRHRGPAAAAAAMSYTGNQEDCGRDQQQNGRDAPAPSVAKVAQASLPVPPVLLNSRRAPHTFGIRARSSTLGAPRPMALYDPAPSFPSLANASQTSPSTLSLASEAEYMPAGIPQRRQRSSSYFETYYGREYTGHSFPLQRNVGNLAAVPPSPTLADLAASEQTQIIELPVAERDEKNSFLDMQNSPMELAHGHCAEKGVESWRKGEQGGKGWTARSFLDLNDSVGPSSQY